MSEYQDALAKMTDELHIRDSRMANYAEIIANTTKQISEMEDSTKEIILLRKKVNGRYEKVQTIHSWNSNHFVGRIVLYELTRHSDHHYRTSKKYQILENKNESPQLPFGYPTSMLISMIPPLWYKLMNPRLV